MRLLLVEDDPELGPSLKHELEQQGFAVDLAEDGRTGEYLDQDESVAIVKELLAQHARPEYTCRFRWEEGSIAFWDNRAVQHYAASDYFPHERVLRRVTISGDKPYYAP